MDCDTIFDRTDGRATWTVVHYRHLSEAVALIQRSEQVILSAPGFQYGGFAHFEDEHRIAFVALAENEIVSGDGRDRTRIGL